MKKEFAIARGGIHRASVRQAARFTAPRKAVHGRKSGGTIREKAGKLRNVTTAKGAGMESSRAAIRYGAFGMSNVVGTRTLNYSALEALQRFYAAEEQYVSSGGLDFDVVANTIHPDIVLFQAESLPYGGEYRGHSSFKNWLDRMAEAWSSVRARGPVFIEHGADTIVSLVTMEAEARATRRQIQMPVCQVVRVQDGLPIEWRVFYWDTFALNDALGHSPRRNT